MNNNIKTIGTIAVVALALAGCAQQDSTGPAPRTTTAATAPVEDSPIHQAKYGTPTILDNQAGKSIELTIDAPELVVYHDAEYDPKTGTKPGTPYPPMLLVKIAAKGVTGSVSIKAYDSIGWQYEAPDGTLYDESFPPLMTYERAGSDDGPAIVGPGQKTTGSIFFQSPTPGGKVIAKVMGAKLTDAPNTWMFS